MPGIGEFGQAPEARLSMEAPENLKAPSGGVAGTLGWRKRGASGNELWDSESMEGRSIRVRQGVDDGRNVAFFATLQHSITPPAQLVSPSPKILVWT